MPRTPSTTEGTIPTSRGAVAPPPASAAELAAWREEEAAAARQSLIVKAGDGFVSVPMRPASTIALVSFVVTVTEPNLDAVIGLSRGAPATFDHLAAAVRFSPSGVIEVRDGAAYRGTHPYHPGKPYRIFVVADVLQHTYSVYVHETDYQEWTVCLAQSYAFRPSQVGVTSLDTLSAIVDGPSGQLTIHPAVDYDTSAVAYTREGRYSAVVPLPHEQALLSDRVAMTWKLGPAGQVIGDLLRGGEVAADPAGNVYVAHAHGGKLAIHAFSPELGPRWSRVDDLDAPLANVQAIAADAAGVSIWLGTAQGGSIRRYPADGGPERWSRDGGTVAALGREGVAVATQALDGISVTFYGLDGGQRWSRSFDVAATPEVMTLGLDGRVVLGGHFTAPITFGGPTLEPVFVGGELDINSYAVAFGQVDGAHVFTTRIPATRLTGVGANAGRVAFAGEEIAQQVSPHVWQLDPAGNALGAPRSSVFFHDWGRSGRVAIDAANRLYWELAVVLWGFNRADPGFPYLVVLAP